MIEFGRTLREAREAKGLTTSQVAESTHMMVQMVENLENENFTRIAAPIYGRGFVKLYCEAVGLDPKPLIDEFMAIFSGNRTPTIKVREPAAVRRAPVPTPAPEPVTRPAPAPAPVPEPEPVVAEPEPLPESEPLPEPVAAEPPPVPEPIAAPPPPPAQDTLFSFANRPAPQPELRPITPSPVQRPAMPVSRATTMTASASAEDELPGIARRPYSRYSSPATDAHPPRFGLPAIPPAVWRILVLAIAALAILWLLLVGVRALYRATMTTPAEEPVTIEETAPAAPAPVATPAAPAETKKPSAAPASAPRTPMEVPALFID